MSSKMKCNRYTRQFIYKWHARFNPAFNCQVVVKTGKLIWIHVEIIYITFILWCSKMKCNRYTRQFIFKLHARFNPAFNCHPFCKCLSHFCQLSPDHLQFAKMNIVVVNFDEISDLSYKNFVLCKLRISAIR